MGEGGEDRHAEEHHPEDGAHEHQGRAGVRAWGTRKMLTPLEMASVPVMAELPWAKARRRKKAEMPRISPPLANGRAASVPAPSGAWGRPVVGCFDQPGHDEQRHVGDEEVGGDGEDLAGLADAAEVAVGQDQRRSPIDIGHGVVGQGGDGRNDGVGPGRH